MITVMFSSRNGGGHLKRMMDGFSALRAPSGGWKLIAVDNGSTDGSGDVMRSYADRIPLTVITEMTPGKNRALNRALDLAEGDFYIFTDDDVVVQNDWLEKWREIADSHQDYDLFAGCVRPLWPCEPPRQVLSGVNVNVLYAAHVGVQEGPCSAACMHGPNMAARASAFQNNRRYNAEIGPDGSLNYAMGSDTELALRLESLGMKCWFATAPNLEHIVRPEQLEQAWILGRGYRWGRGLAQMHLPYPNSPRGLARRNGLKKLLYPILLPLLPWEVRWRRQWHDAVDRGYEDGTRETLGQKRRWG